MSAEMAFNTLEKMMERNWKKKVFDKDDETLNDGGIVENDDSDEGLNY